MEKARRHLDEAIYGQDEAKLQVLQFIGTKISNPTGRGLSLLLAGPPGIGKTSLIKNGIAKALNWPFQFISLGGDSDASTYTGHQLVYESSHCGKIVNSLAAAKSMSMVLMFDEADKISTTPKGEEVQHLLIHLTDPVQNGDFEDKYLSGIPIDLSRVMFVFSANDLGRIDKVLLDRFTVIQLQGYSQKEKLTIAEKYLLPDALKQVDLVEKIGITKDALQYVIDEYAKEESGVRELKRCIDQIVQKLNMLRMFNTDQLPFHIKNFSLPFMVKKEHIDLFLKKKKSTLDESALRMYT
jgi:ATP-dependent Lon protease